MAYQDKLLLRTSLSDIGDKKVHGSYCSSPDMIAHALVDHPQEEFGGNYDKDPNQKVDKFSRTNTIYIRVKSMQNADEPVEGYVRLYRANCSLFMNTDKWKNNKLFTPKGKSYVKVTTRKNGDISVGDDVLVVDGRQPNFCMVGIVNDSEDETLPDVFRSYSAFVSWVHSERCVAVRNFSLECSGTRNDYEILYNFSNPESKPRLGSILIEASKLPKGTIYGLVNDAMGMNKSAVYDPDDEITKQVTDSAYLRASFDGYVRIYARVPDGAVWPADAVLETSFWISAEDGEDMLQFAKPAENVLMNTASLMRCRESNRDPGRLVKVGACVTMYI